jgi:hypothetical protein
MKKTKHTEAEIIGVVNRGKRAGRLRIWRARRE